MFFGITCPACQAEIEADVEIQSYGRSATWTSPAEGPSWVFPAYVKCDVCGHDLTCEELDTIQRNDEERLIKAIADHEASRDEDF